ncbi:hypothetical protein MKC55_07830 [[Clostridium] innocuum]|nr:hypothetical protein [[Clostridium] innocuum]EFR38883.1 hypothetical protein HMPREF9406_1059 [Clostridium sp. HGF2]MCI2999327.1 hypothetical protein [[Clostridium] innocuum]MCI3013542.1 hypothetical protein [[Clostridium] innocuum]MCR0169376.1 hypothetical protein [[Clostridium] innocuum]MCR0209542.1 hypothetical protein [[Clostridium] innocuum]
MGFSIHKNLIQKDQEGNIKRTSITSKSGKEYTYATVSVPNANLGGIKSEDGIQINKTESVHFLVPIYSISEDQYHSDRSFITLKDDYIIPSVQVDMGKTGKQLENGKNEHQFLKVRNMTVEQLKECMPQNQWLRFTISREQKGNDYMNSKNEPRTTILMPDGAYKGCRIVINPKCISEIPEKDHLLSVSLNNKAEFNILSNSVKSIDPATGKKDYETKVVKEKVTAAELQEYFINRPKADQEVSIVNEQHPVLPETDILTEEGADTIDENEESSEDGLVQ